MTVYKYFLKTAIRQKWIILGYAIIFFILSIINGANTDIRETAFMEYSLDIGIVNNSPSSELSQGLIDYLNEKNNIVPMEDDIDYINEQIFLEAVDAVIIIAEDFEMKVRNKEGSIEIIRDDREMGPLQIGNEINKFLAFANATYKDGKFNLEKIKTSLNEKVDVELIKTANVPVNDGVSIWFNSYFNFTGYIIIAIYVAIIGLLMTEFNSKDIQDRMKISSKKFLRFNGEMYFAQVTLGIIITGIFILGSIALKGKYIGEVNFIKYVINLYVFSFSILCFTFLINNLTSSTFVINGVSTVASLGTAFISGVLVPQEFLGQKVLAIAKFFPTYYFVRINDMRIDSFIDIRYEIFMQMLFAFTFLAIGLYLSKAKQKT